MKTECFSTLPPEFEFASFTFPKYVWTLPKGSKADRLERAKNRCTGGYYSAPKPSDAGKGMSFYLDSDFMPGLRWQWCDDVCTSIRHTGWYSDEFGDSEKIRGIVMRLPKGRGFLAGWSMGKGMASFVDCYIYDDEKEAARGADREAEIAAEKQRDFEIAERERIEAEEQKEAEEFADEVNA